MSHQRYSSHDAVKEPHAISLKVLRLSRPSLVTQYPVASPLADSATNSAPVAASLAYTSKANTNPSPFLLSPVLNFPVSFGSTYVGETFSCTLCANNDLPAETTKTIRDVRIDAEMKTPGTGAVQKLELGPRGDGEEEGAEAAGTDLGVGDTLQRVVAFDLKEEGNHVLAVTVSYYEAAETSGRTRTFRKLYQFICKSSLIVRTKVGPLRPGLAAPAGSRRWVLEAQLENSSEDVMQLEKVVMDVEDGLRYRDCNWDAAAAATTTTTEGLGQRSVKPVLHPGEVEQVCFMVEEDASAAEPPAVTADGRVVFGVLGVGWRGDMGNHGFLTTGKLGARVSS